MILTTEDPAAHSWTEVVKSPGFLEARMLGLSYSLNFDADGRTGAITLSTPDGTISGHGDVPVLMASLVRNYLTLSDKRVPVRPDNPSDKELMVVFLDGASVPPPTTYLVACARVHPAADRWSGLARAVEQMLIPTRSDLMGVRWSAHLDTGFTRAQLVDAWTRAETSPRLWWNPLDQTVCHYHPIASQ